MWVMVEAVRYSGVMAASGRITDNTPVTVISVIHGATQDTHRIQAGVIFVDGVLDISELMRTIFPEAISINVVKRYSMGGRLWCAAGHRAEDRGIF